MSAPELHGLGWSQVDVLLVSGDAYIDHPAFGVALLGRWLTAHGFRVGIVAQPRWDRLEDIMALGRPRLFAGVTAGALDSMLAHYTAFRRIRRDDAYTPGGRAGARPNRACIVYTNLVRRAFPDLPVILGGIEASLRRIAHYDFWTDAVRRSILLDSKADLLLYGMAERGLLAAAHGLNQAAGQAENMAHRAPHTRITALPFARDLPGAVLALPAGSIEPDQDALQLPSLEDIKASPGTLIQATRLLEEHVHAGRQRALHPSGDRILLLTPPAAPLSSTEMDALYALPFSRRAHPSYQREIPAARMMAASITSHRGCGGGCSFCSLALHQGRTITSRGLESILSEVRQLARMPDWDGVITDVGGPSANMWQGKCTRQSPRCQRNSCLHPNICRFFQVDQQAILGMLEQVQKQPGVRRVRVASGVRFDLLLQDRTAAAGLLHNFVGGQLKLAPEHASPRVLKLMRKPDFDIFKTMLAFFQDESAKAKKNQFIVPYLMSAFPGCTMQDMTDLATWFKKMGWRPQQVQCFVPTPGTMATAMFYAGTDPQGIPIPVARNDAQRQRQHAVLAPLPAKNAGIKARTTARRPTRG